MTTTADALEVMTIIAACHHRTAPRLDDPQAARATATIWAELFNTYNLELDDLLAAVKKRACVHPEAPEPAEIITYARDIRRDRTERETDAERRAREDQHDHQLEQRQRVIAAKINTLADTKALPGNEPAGRAELPAEGTPTRQGTRQPEGLDTVSKHTSFRPSLPERAVVGAEYGIA